ncbi:hypothetical protein E2C01_040620 [Portunus trituberculatus]|uniref:Uncharacterized protein n=1 Tax=Portunus trituberculatus TaxID=210409 RepID=A0A5B7FH60_PORTR|nr:hypothetical protein [Portunus trituberculatus]
MKYELLRALSAVETVNPFMVAMVVIRNTPEDGNSILVGNIDWLRSMTVTTYAGNITVKSNTMVRDEVVTVTRFPGVWIVLWSQSYPKIGP